MAARNHFFGDRENRITIRQFGNWFSVFSAFCFFFSPINDIDFKSVILTRVGREKNATQIEFNSAWLRVYVVLSKHKNQSILFLFFCISF